MVQGFRREVGYSVWREDAICTPFAMTEVIKYSARATSLSTVDMNSFAERNVHELLLLHTQHKCPSVVQVLARALLCSTSFPTGGTAHGGPGPAYRYLRPNEKPNR